MRNRFLENVMRVRDEEHEREILIAKSFGAKRGRPPLCAVIDDELKRRIVERARSPGFRSAIAAEFGVSKSFVSALLKKTGS